MPLDRIVTVNVETRGAYNDVGRYVEGVVTPLRVWASKTDRNLMDVLETGGNRGEIQRTWRVRWNAAIYAAQPELLAVEDEGLVYDIQNMAEVTDRDGMTRRRFIDLTGVWYA